MRGFSKAEVAGFFITGAALGAITALLAAPKSGERTRKDIRRFSRKTMDQFDELQSDLREQITETYSQVKRLIKTA
jgi:gas vesicle protein